MSMNMQVSLWAPAFNSSAYDLIERAGVLFDFSFFSFLNSILILLCVVLGIEPCACWASSTLPLS